MASSAEKPHYHHHHMPSTPFGTTAAPPPTPSTQPNLSSESTTTDFLSHLLHRLPPALSLSLPTRRSSPLSSSSAAATPPLISLSDSTPSLHSALLSASTELGYFHLTQHGISSSLALSAESAAVSLFNLPHHQKHLLFPSSNWPLGHEIIDDDYDDSSSSSSSAAESFCLDSSCFTESTTESELNLDSLREFTRELEKLGMELVEELASAVGFENPGRSDLSSLMWISNGSDKPGRVYPYALGLHYEIKRQKQSLLSDSGWVSVTTPADSILVTLGDIAHVWSNGKMKKVRGRGVQSSGGDEDCITMSLLITLPLESTVSPRTIDLVANGERDSVGDDENKISSEPRLLFNTFSFEEYAWRVYHERLQLKDPLIRYRL